MTISNEFKEYISTYLKENLTIEVEQEKGQYNEKHTKIKLILNKEVISSDYLELDL